MIVSAPFSGERKNSLSTRNKRPNQPPLESPKRTEINIWRAATLMLKRYGDKALEHSRTRIDESPG